MTANATVYARYFARRSKILGVLTATGLCETRKPHSPKKLSAAVLQDGFGLRRETFPNSHLPLVVGRRL